MLPGWFVFVAIILRLGSGTGYVISVIKGKTKPNPISWFLWALTSMITFFAQLQAGVGIQALITLALGLSPLVVFSISIFKSRSATHFTKTNVACAAAALVGIILWRSTNDPVLAIAFSIMADFLAGVPTLIKSYHRPHTEYAPTYLISAISMIITMLTITNWTFANYAYPVYIFSINVAIFVLIRSKIGEHRAIIQSAPDEI